MVITMGVSCSRTSLFLLCFYVIFLLFVVYYMYYRDARSTEKIIRDPGHIIEDNEDTSTWSKPGKQDSKSGILLPSNIGYKFDMQRILRSESPQVVDLEQGKLLQASLLRDYIPKFDDIPPFWDFPVAVKKDTPSESPVSSQSTSKTYVLETSQFTAEDMNIHVVYGSSLASNGSYVVISCFPALSDREINYAFYLPMDILAWKRAGFRTIIILIGSQAKWQARPGLNTVLIELFKTDAILIFMDAPNKQCVMLSQVSRLFVSVMLNWTGIEQSYLVLADADLWPVKLGVYDLPPEKKILSLNSECCGTFSHKGQRYKMLPMCNIGMTVQTWRQVMHFHASANKSLSYFILKNVESIIEYVKEEFGDIATMPVSKGENAGWFLDQRLISMRIAQWAEGHGSDGIHYVRRDTGRDRIDRSHWQPLLSSHTLDAHLLEQPYLPERWPQMMPLIKLLFPESTWSSFERYREHFLNATQAYEESPIKY